MKHEKGEMRIAIGLTITVLLALPVQAQTTDYYGPSGGYQGHSITTPRPFGGGSTTDFYGPSGGYQGSFTTTPRPFGGGSTTDFYGPSGGYEGSATTTRPPFGSFGGRR
jgi:hypothetical protein